MNLKAKRKNLKKKPRRIPVTEIAKKILKIKILETKDKMYVYHLMLKT